MLQRDYLLEVISQFVEAVSRALLVARAAQDEPAALEAAGEVEHEVAGLLDMDPDVAMQLTPDSLVTMMLLSGMGDALAGYVAFALSRAADGYDRAGDPDTAGARRAQAEAIAGSFGVDTEEPPEELRPLAGQLDE